MVGSICSEVVLTISLCDGVDCSGASSVGLEGMRNEAGSRW